MHNNAISKTHILVVDDDERLLSLITRYLKKEGFWVSSADSAFTARALMRFLKFDLAIVDWMMPQESGIEFSRTLRHNSDMPIIMLTARAEIDDRIDGLSVGVDDYITKPFDPRELILRIKAILKRSQASQPEISHKESYIAFGAFRFDMQKAILTKNAIEVTLTETEKMALTLLAKAKGSPVSRHQFMDEADDKSGRAVDVLINRLRKKVEEDPSLPKYIHTMRGKGYYLRCD